MSQIHKDFGATLAIAELALENCDDILRELARECGEKHWAVKMYRATTERMRERFTEIDNNQKMRFAQIMEEVKNDSAR